MNASQVVNKTASVKVRSNASERKGHAIQPQTLKARRSPLQGAPVELKSNASNFSRAAFKTEAVAAPDAATGRVFNFSAGPAVLPLDVLEKAQSDLVNWEGCGMSVMEMSHRGKNFTSIYNKAQADLKKLLEVPDNYKILFMQGGASTQFACLPLNLTESPEDTVDFVVTGSWGKKAYQECGRYCKTNIAADGKEYAGKYTDIPPQSEWKLTPGAKYVHICENETIQGVEFKEVPETEALLVADMSSNFLSHPIDVSKYGVIYAGAQKNLGPAGVTIVIVREDLIGKARPECPVMLDYETMAANDSMYNTPPCFSIYMCGLVFEKLLSMGGLAEVQKYNEQKAAVIYNAIDASEGFYTCPNAAGVKSLMNIPFTMATPELEKAFIAEAAEAGLMELKGHRSVGGVRASIYNSMPMEGVEALANFMKEFQARNQ
mmetsp:Transcript_42511/g.51614  ORF Transcript_42511/g.51614 Transcript_42511/m.51614 type:complete len:433 (+) Transcript_42511:80-1378(+)|eukprot:CAMPEP_0197846712 /NCGR_PEP_ID=MMETSP1438-20131217/4083_1 /TAXON_ID=1461541 /ORGANISM="Pterosperma sp., Strain CCMP1384" /LENGTH=432 /DNA_ID=CAMNT_0043458451 /DNA_START=68 /DNA_END=1366 /DNA_ORIENTATION=+